MIVLKILFFLLKLIGIVLLAILLLLLFLLLVVLFTPLRYKADIKREDGSISGRVKLSYLFGAVRLPVIIADGKPVISLKLLWRTLFTNDGTKPKKEKKVKRVRKKKHSAAGSNPENAEVASSESEEEHQEEKQAEEEPEEKRQAGEEPEEKDREETAGTPAETVEVPADASADGTTENADGNRNGAADDESSEECPDGWFGRLWKKITGPVKRIFHTIIGIKEKILGILQKLEELPDKLDSLWGKGQLVFDFLSEEINKNAIKMTGNSIFRLIKYILPYKIKGEVIFGTGNPYSMGQALSVLGILYPVYAKNLLLQADFETESFRLEGHVKLAGRIRPARLIWIVLRLLIKGKGGRVLRNINKLKKELAS